ncbi:MAG: hypothetical protein JSW54_03390, partial [Fidelibacterota bacterium]
MAFVTPPNSQLDLKLARMFSLGPVGITAYAYVQNVTNRKNIINVYYRTGSDNDGALSYRWFRYYAEYAIQEYGENFLALYEE